MSQQHVQSVPEKLSVAENSSKDTIEIKFNANESVHNMQPPTPDTVQNSPRDEADQNQDNDGPQLDVSTHMFLDSIIESINSFSTVNCINFFETLRYFRTDWFKSIETFEPCFDFEVPTPC